MERKTTAAAGAIEPLRPENQQLLAFLDELATRPDEKDAEWWEEFRTFLRTTPLRLGPPPGE